MELGKIIEIFTLVTGVFYIILEVRQKNFMWIVGIVTSLAAMYMFFVEKLYASFVLNLYYFAISFWGLYRWGKDTRVLREQVAGTQDIVNKSVEGKASATRPREDGATGGKMAGDAVHLFRLGWKTVAGCLVAFVIGTAALKLVLNALNDPMSILDAVVAALSAVATYMLSRSYIQQWWVWIVADLCSTLLCASQGLYWMVALYALYTLSAGYGYWYWKKKGIYLDT